MTQSSSQGPIERSNKPALHFVSDRRLFAEVGMKDIESMRVLIAMLLYCIFIFSPVHSGDFWEIKERKLLIKEKPIRKILLGFKDYCAKYRKKVSENLTYDSTEEAKNWRYGRLNYYVDYDGRRWLNGTRIFKQEYRIWNETWHLRNITLRETAYYIAKQMAAYGDVCEVRRIENGPTANN
ncbi:unnamed protein product [Cylicostephanus goldi]|uniref:Uncharacterized protein n=1 Tax=Cylicostephanus goldi TaxID=71465 RepID=A0A3P7LR16_CYLGO|nr:unnamed protein product [Cylicostephanus goldi]